MKAPANFESGCSMQRSPRASSGFAGTSNPRHRRALLTLLRRPMTREALDREAGCSNSPDLIAELRRRGLEIPCTRVDAFDQDGRPCKPGVYHLTEADKRKVYRWFKQGGH